MKFKKKAGLLMVGMVAAVSVTGCGSQVKLGEYKGIEASRVVCDISEQELNDAVEEMMYDYITYDPVTDRAAQDGDYVNIDYVITKVDGQPYKYASEGDDEEEASEEATDEAADEEEASEEGDDESGSEDPYSGYGEDIVIGEEYIYPEVEQALVGMNTGDKKTVSAKLTEDYVDEDLAGKTADIEVTLNEIMLENKPEYNDEFVKTNLGFDTIAEYEESLKKDLLSEKEEEYKTESVSEIVQKIIDNSKFGDYEKKTYEACEEEYNSGNEQMAAMYGMELADYEELMGITADAKKQDIVAMVHERQVVEAIAEKEGIKVSDDDIKKLAEDNYAEYEYDSADKFIEDYGKEYLTYYLLSEKVYDFLYDNAKLTDISEEEYNKNASEESEEETDDGQDVEVNLDDAEEEAGDGQDAEE